MQILHRCCCGLDVHKKLIVACLISLNESGDSRDRDPVLYDHDQRHLGVSGLAHECRMHPYRHGVDGSVLETHLDPLRRAV